MFKLADPLRISLHLSRVGGRRMVWCNVVPPCRYIGVSMNNRPICCVTWAFCRILSPMRTSGRRKRSMKPALNDKCAWAGGCERSCAFMRPAKFDLQILNKFAWDFPYTCQASASLMRPCYEVDDWESTQNWTQQRTKPGTSTQYQLQMGCATDSWCQWHFRNKSWSKNDCC